MCEIIIIIMIIIMMIIIIIIIIIDTSRDKLWNTCRPGLIVPVWVLSMGQIDQFKCFHTRLNRVKKKNLKKEKLHQKYK